MILFKLYSQMLTHDRMASCQSWGRARAWAEGDYGKIFFMPSREFILLLILLEALPEERPLPTPEEVDARLTSLSLPPLDSAAALSRFFFGEYNKLLCEGS